MERNGTEWDGMKRSGTESDHDKTEEKRMIQTEGRG